MADLEVDDAELSDADFAKSLKKKPKWPYFAAVAVAVVAMIGVVLWYYSPSAQLTRLIGKVKQCKLVTKGPGKGSPVSADCMQHVSALSAQMPGACPKVLAAIRESKGRTPQNLLLYAMLSGRARAWRGKKFSTAALKGDACLEKAVLHVHKSHRGNKEAAGDGISGLEWYNHKLLDQLESWIIRVHVVGQLSPQSVANIYDRLQVHAVNFKKLVPGNAEKDGITKTVRKALRPRLADVYKRIVQEHLSRPGHSKAEAAYKFPEYLDDDIGYKIDPKGPLAKSLLHTYFVLLPFAAAGEHYLMRWHKDLFRRHLLEVLEWETAMAAMLDKLAQLHLGLLLKFLTANPELPLRTGGKVPEWYTRSLEMLSTQSEPSHHLVKHLFTPLVKVTAMQLPGAPVERLVLLGDLYVPRQLQRWTSYSWERNEAAGELARAGVAAALVLGLAKHDNFDWLRSSSNFRDYAWMLKWLKLGSCAQGCANPAKLRRAEAAMLLSEAVKPNLQMDREELEKWLKFTEPNYRAITKFRTVYVPMKKRLKYVESGLTDKQPSVRAFTVLALSLGLTRQADIDAAAQRIVKLSGDPSWLVRMMVFYRLWLLERTEDLKPFLKDPTPQIVKGWRKLLTTWKTPNLVALLARTDRAAGVVLPVLAARAKQPKNPWTVDWNALGALANHANPWTRIQLIQHFGEAGRTRLNWGALLTAKEMTVRAAALDFWVTSGAKKPPGAELTKHSATLVKLLQDPHYGIKRLAALVLTRLKSKAALPVLQKLQKHPACALRNIAGAALAELKGGTHKPTRCAFELFGL